MGIKPKTSFRHFITTRCSRWLAVLATHIPRRPKKKPLRGKKVGFAEKKLRLTQKKLAHRVYQGWHVPTCGDLPQSTLRGSLLSVSLSPSCASGFAFACMLSTISHLDGELEIAKGRLFCNQIPHNPFITKILIQFFATKNFKEKTFPNHPSTP